MPRPVAQPLLPGAYVALLISGPSAKALIAMMSEDEHAMFHCRDAPDRPARYWARNRELRREAAKAMDGRIARTVWIRMAEEQARAKQRKIVKQQRRAA